MIKQMAFTLGLGTVLGTGGLVGYDYKQQAAFSHDPSFGMLLYLENKMARAGLAGAPGSDTRRASLPSTYGKSVSPDTPYWQLSAEEELYQMAPHVPQVKEYLEIDAERTRNSMWSRVRHKVTGTAASSQPLSDIHKRDAPEETQEESIWDSFFGMSTLDKYKNRSSRSKKARQRQIPQQGSGIAWQKSRD